MLINHPILYNIYYKNLLSRLAAWLMPLCLLLSACSSSEEATADASRRHNQQGEYIYRHHAEKLYSLSPLTKTAALLYPWEVGVSHHYPKITKEFFRCKGSPLNPVHSAQGKTAAAEPLRHFDCGGTARHSLPLRKNKEFIYPILIDILNDIQLNTGKRVVITSGHRCPEHNVYSDPATSNQSSKHLIGAEVSFYVQGLENQPEKVIQLILNFYREKPKYKGRKDYTEIKRYDKGDVNVAEQPWYNKEIFIKLFNKKEGRDFDNRHPYPYISMQVRFDEELQEKVIYTWDKANHNYLRW